MTGAAMEGFSFGQAIGAGFRVMGRNPVAVLMWAAVYLVFLLLPALALLRYVLPDMISAMQQAAEHAAEHTRPDPAAMMALRSRGYGLQPALWVLSVVVNTVVIGAIFRSVLEPEKGRFGYLRLGGQELWLGLTYLVITVMTVIMVFILVFPVAIAAGIGAAMAQHGTGTPLVGLVVTLLALGGFGVILWVLLRLSLALPMSFAQGRFLLYESWDLTRGHALKMFGVYLVLVLGLAVLELIFVFTVGASVFQARHADPQFASHFAGRIAQFVATSWPTIAGFAVLISIIGMAVRTVTVAPLAEIYRELTAREAA
jgi:hypothetical protein